MIIFMLIGSKDLLVKFSIRSVVKKVDSTDLPACWHVKVFFSLYSLIRVLVAVIFPK